jgi:hypothetical protein
MLATVPEPALARLTPNAIPSAAALSSVPPRYLTLYTGAAKTCPGLPWQVLAAIGTIESGNGSSAAPDVHGPVGYGSPEGPMQFEAATFDAYAVRADKRRRISPYDPADAIYTAARMLCADGAYGGSLDGITQAVYAYNHAWWYVNDVLSLAEKYSGPTLRPFPAVRPVPSVRPGLAPQPPSQRVPAGSSLCSPDRIRTGVTALRGRRPRPLDDGAVPCPGSTSPGCKPAISSGVQTTASTPPGPTGGSNTPTGAPTGAESSTLAPGASASLVPGASASAVVSLSAGGTASASPGVSLSPAGTVDASPTISASVSVSPSASVGPSASATSATSVAPSGTVSADPSAQPPVGATAAVTSSALLVTGVPSASTTVSPGPTLISPPPAVAVRSTCQGARPHPSCGRDAAKPCPPGASPIAAATATAPSVDAPCGPASILTSPVPASPSPVSVSTAGSATVQTPASTPTPTPSSAASSAAVGSETLTEANPGLLGPLQAETSSSLLYELPPAAQSPVVAPTGAPGTATCAASPAASAADTSSTSAPDPSASLG